MRARLTPSALVAGAAAIAFAAAVFPSVPVLRHDWSPYPFGVGPRELFWIGTSGWGTSGIGAPMPYPQGYLIAPVLAVVRLVLSPGATLLAFMLAIGVFCAFGGRAIAKFFGSGEVAASAAALFLTFNPWTFTELVAGHTYMLLAYGASIWLVAETLRERPRASVLILCLLGTVQQIQFFLLATMILAAIAWKKRIFMPLMVAALVWLPSVIGIVADRSDLASIPFTLTWQQNESIAPLGALVFSGYVAQYGAQFTGWHSLPMQVIGLLALLGFALSIRRHRPMVGVAAVTLVALIVAMGVHGPLSSVYVWSVEHVVAIAVFRELYDLIGFAAIGYAILAVSVTVRTATWTFLVAAAALAAIWWFPPPNRWWVDPSQLSPAAITAPRNTRFALVPAFQPLSYEGRGSGVDPDASARSENVTPLNLSLPMYPVDAALAAFIYNGDDSRLRALSVASVVSRSQLQTRAEALQEQWPFAPIRSLSPRAVDRTITLTALPELSIFATPAVGTLDNQLGSGNIFFGDVASANNFFPIKAPSRDVRADQGWVDVRLAFAQRPQLAQGIGGALTTDSHAGLNVRPGLKGLVWIDGTLRSQDGLILSHSTNGYEWIEFPGSVTEVACTGTCVVAAEGVPPNAPSNPPSRPYQGLDFVALTPWLVRASLPAGTQGALRYNVTYDTGWIAYADDAQLQHVRLDTSVNGWFLPKRATATQLLIVHRVAAAQAVTELVVVTVLLVLAGRRLVLRSGVR